MGGFLAFGLYLLNLVMNMDGGMKRKKRSVDECDSNFDISKEKELMEGSLAFFHMLKGFLATSQHYQDSSCGYLSLCQAAAEASSLGKIGEIVAKAASSNIAGLLDHKYDYSESEIENSGYIGAERKQCKKSYSCK